MPLQDAGVQTVLPRDEPIVGCRQLEFGSLILITDLYRKDLFKFHSSHLWSPVFLVE